MYCKTCGTQLADTASFCLQCGSPVGDAQPAVAQPMAVQPAVAPVVVAKGKKKPGLLLGGIAAVLVVVLLLCLTGGSVNGSPETLAEAVVIGEYENDADRTVECLADFSVKALAEEMGLSSRASRGEVVDALEVRRGGAEPASVEIISTEITRSQEKGDFIILRELYDYMTKEDLESISRLVRVKVTFAVDGNQRWWEIPCVEIDGDWYYLRQE